MFPRHKGISDRHTENMLVGGKSSVFVVVTTPAKTRGTKQGYVLEDGIVEKSPVH